MRNLETLINDMKSTQIISRSKAQNSTSVVGQVASAYADIIQAWIIRLEEANRVGDLNLQLFASAVNKEIDELEILFPERSING